LILTKKDKVHKIEKLKLIVEFISKDDLAVIISGI